ncbi:MAG: hypothetical protein NVV59_18285 [Chitinophagaceae bacterium]|nr:hypothetical protein [Chitinophagaceae bacterium]
MTLHFTKVTIIAAVLLSLACAKKGGTASEPEPDPEEEIVFCTNFEEGNFDLWDDWDGNPAPSNVLVADPGPHNKPGNHVARLRVPAGRGSADLLKVLPKQYKKLYARWYVQWEPGYDFNARNHGGGLIAGARNFVGQSDNRPDGTNFASALFETHTRQHRPVLYSYYRGMYQDCRNPIGSCWGDGFPCYADNGQVFCTKPEDRPIEGKVPPELTTGKWYRVEIMMDMGKATSNASDADGILNMWVDGVEYGPWKNLWFRTTNDLKLSIIWMQLFHHDTHAAEGILIDDLVVSTAPIGGSSPCN